MTDADLTYDVFGYAGSTCLTILYIPQVLQVYQTKKAEDLALLSLVLQFLTSLSFIVYGYGIESYPILIANISGITCASLLMLGKWKYRPIHSGTPIPIPTSQANPTDV